MSKPRIAITMGDPAGIGPEICLDLLNDRAISSKCTPIVFGDWSVLQTCAEKTNKSFEISKISATEFSGIQSPTVFDHAIIDPSNFTAGTADAKTGRATYGYVTSAIDACLTNKIDAVVTCPANKEALQAAGVKQPGHTEIFAEHTGTEKFCMAFFSDEISCSLVTVHCGYTEVPDLLSVDRIYEVISLTRQAHQKLLGREPNLAVCGLNPHGGENGLFGNQEEEKLITPAIKKARAEGTKLIGPLPPDTAFTANNRESIDAYVCMYHDQGLIPVKALAFEEAVNVTLGLPIIRTSVDHGTALDIAWQGKADPSSLKSAVRLAIRMFI